jgi:hypothetical protein
MTFRKLLVAASAAATFAGISGLAQAATPATATASASATIVSPSTLAATRALAFGQIAKPTSGTSTIKVLSAASAAATPTITGGNAYVTTSGQAAAAAFHLTGTANQTYTIDAGYPLLTFTGSAGNLASVGAETPVAAGGTVGTLPGSGVDDLYIGGHFDITSSTAVQTYNGSLQLNITYN